MPATDLPGFIAGFRTPPFSTEKELSGAPFANLSWTPAATDSQLVVELFDEAPDGKLTLFSRGVQGLRGAVPGVERQVRIDGNAFSIRIPAGHRVRAWVMAGNSGLLQALSRLGGRRAADGRRLDARAAAALGAETLDD